MSDLNRNPLFGRARIRAALLATSALAGTTLATTAVATGVAPSAGVAAALSASPARTAAALSNSPIVGLAPSGSGGYWMVSSTGGVFSFGSAPFHGSLGGRALAKPIVGMTATATGNGYWLVASDGGVFAFGDAAFHGSMGGKRLAKPIVAMAATATGNGYWLVASDGGLFAFGDAAFHGSMGGKRLAKPIVGMARTATGHGYWMVASDGGMFAFGDAAYHGSMGGRPLARPIVGMAATATGSGYWLVANDGGIFNFGNAGFHGSAVSFNSPTGAKAVGIIPMGGGYWVPNNLGQVDALGTTAPAGPSQPVFSSSAPSGLPASAVPSTSIAPSNAFARACWVAPVNAGNCDAAALADINSARAAEGYGPMGLPSNFESLSMQQQLVAVANAERTSRGLPAFPENGTLDHLAQLGAQANGGVGADPTGPAGYAWRSNIAWGDPTALSADFSWMYDDGPGSENIDCSVAGAAGCWGHRLNILAPWGGAAGAGEYINQGTVQLTQLFVQAY